MIYIKGVHLGVTVNIHWGTKDALKYASAKVAEMPISAFNAQ